MGFLKLSDGEEIFYRDQGEGPAVILIHGWPLNADMWEYQVPALLDHGYRVISYDRRGFGRSSQPATGYDYDTFASDLKELINQLELQSCTLIGFSMGGGEIARYLGNFGSEKISRAILISSIVPYMLKTGDNPEGVEQGNFDKIIEGLKKDRPHFLRGFAKDFFGASLLNMSVSDEILQWSLMHSLMASPVASIECVKAFSQTDFREDIKAFDVPTLIIHGGNDKTVPISASSERVAKMIPTAEFIKYESAPHGLFFTHKDELILDLTKFLGRTVDEPQHFRRDQPAHTPFI